MNSKITKGPWKAKQLLTQQGDEWVVLWPDKDGAHMRRLDCQGKFSEPDARLIAAAPDILAAAIAVIERWDTPKWKDAPATANYIYALRQSVAKATESERND